MTGGCEDEYFILFPFLMYVIRNLNKLDRVPDELREGIFDKLFEVAEIAKFSPEEVQAYEDSLKSYRDLKNSLDTAFEEGVEQGIEQGIEQRNAEIVKNSLQQGLSVDVVSAISGLSPEEVERIKNEG